MWFDRDIFKEGDDGGDEDEELLEADVAEAVQSIKSKGGEVLTRGDMKSKKGKNGKKEAESSSSEEEEDDGDEESDGELDVAEMKRKKREMDKKKMKEKGSKRNYEPNCIRMQQS